MLVHRYCSILFHQHLFYMVIENQRKYTKSMNTRYKYDAITLYCLIKAYGTSHIPSFFHHSDEKLKYMDLNRINYWYNQSYRYGFTGLT